MKSAGHAETGQNLPERDAGAGARWEYRGLKSDFCTGK